MRFLLDREQGITLREEGEPELGLGPRRGKFCGVKKEKEWGN